MKRHFILGGVLAAFAVVGFLLVSRPTTYERHHDHVLGTSLDLAIAASSVEAADRAEQAILTEIARLDAILSGYNPNSEFSRWSRTSGQAVAVSPELLDVLRLFDTWRDRTGGAVDAAAATISSVWAAAAAHQTLPTDQQLADAVGRVQQAHWTIDAATRSATHLTTAPLVLNSFAKGYVIERAAQVGAAVPGVSGLMVNVGGDLVVRGRMDGTIGVADPRSPADNAAPLARLAVRNRAVATSGGYRRGVDIGGQHYSHIVDPRTGRTTGHVLGATVVARRAVDAGALATAFCVLSPEESAALASTMADVEYMLVLADGSAIESQGWRALASSPTRLALPAPSTSLYAAEQATWDSRFELTVALEIARTGGRRPYVAVWIEDKDRFPVRTLAVWYERNHSKWLADLRAWYRGDRLRSLAEGTALIDTVSSATRSAGAYSLVWDGKDNQGRLVKAGTYTVAIEAAREHGTYQIIRQTIDVPGVARRIDLPGNAEISAASLDYHSISSR